MRFTRLGYNWEGRRWTIPKSLDSLLDEVEAWRPEPRPLDAIVSSKGHDLANPASDHRPTPYSGPGIVRAVDVGEVEPEGDELCEALRKSKDRRIKYVIHEGRIFSSYSTPTRPAWIWGKYSGFNGHFTHVHISMVMAFDSDGSDWELGLGQGDDDMPSPKDWTTADWDAYTKHNIGASAFPGGEPNGSVWQNIIRIKADTTAIRNEVLGLSADVEGLAEALAEIAVSEGVGETVAALLAEKLDG